MIEYDRRPDGLTGEEQELATRLGRERPVPRAGFRGALRRRLAEHDPGYGPRPHRLRLMVAGYTGVGACLIGAGALVATGVL
jgi:hypothetical protein